MYKIPESFNVIRIKHQVIEFITYGLNVVTISFQKGFISFSGGFTLKLEDHIYHYNEVFPVRNDLGLINLLDKEIVEVLINSSRDQLTLRFDKEAELLLNGNPHFESFTIVIDDDKIIV